MDRTEGVDAVDHQAAEKMEARIHWSISGEDRADYPPDGVETSQAAKHRLASIKTSDIGISAFGVGLHRCDSVEF